MLNRFALKPLALRKGGRILGRIGPVRLSPSAAVLPGR